MAALSDLGPRNRLAAGRQSISLLISSGKLNKSWIFFEVTIENLLQLLTCFLNVETRYIYVKITGLRSEP